MARVLNSGNGLGVRMTAAVLNAFRVEGKRIWVTGASRGLGRSIAEGMLSAGARVAATARGTHLLQDLQGFQEVGEGGLLVAAGSVDQSADVLRIARTIDERWGGLDVLVNCAGISSDLTRSETLGEESWRAVLDVNLTGSFLCAQAAARMMLPAGGGSIINVSSIHGTAGVARLAAYGASKGAIEALTRSLALEWASRGVRVNAICPGYFSTDMTQELRDHESFSERLLAKIPLGRFGDPAELVPSVVFLASDASNYMTGAMLHIDGGWTAA